MTRRPHVAVLVADAGERQTLGMPLDAGTRRAGAVWLAAGPVSTDIELRPRADGEWTQRQGPSFEVVPVAPPPQWRKPA